MSENKAKKTGKRSAEAAGEEAPGEDRRRERRYPVVGIELLYSPFDGKVLENAGELVREAVAHDVSLSGLSFDVREAVTPGEELVIQLEDPAGGQAERLLAEVRWCHKLDDAHFRIGTRIQESAPGTPSRAPGRLESIGKGPSVPSGAEFRCPACKKRTQFTLIGLQAGTWEKGVFPLYQCAKCESSRSILAILSYNRTGF